MALEGTLRDFSFADILQLISLQRKTGVLTLKNEDNVVTISFLEGRIIGASSLAQHTEDRLGLILLKLGEVSEVELEAALRKQEETLQRLGRILIDHKVVEAEKVRMALEQQILQIVYRIFRWNDGEYHFSQETDIDYDKDLMIPIAADSIIMEGARMTDEWPFIDKRIPDRNLVYNRVDPTRKFEIVDDEDELDDISFSFSGSPAKPSASKAKEETRLSRNQWLVYKLVNGRDSVNEVILESPLIEFETCAAFAELIELGLIRRASREEVARQMVRDQEPDKAATHGVAALPWLALPFLVLLGFSVTVMTHNPVNPTFSLRKGYWEHFILEAVSWYRIDRLSKTAEVSYHLDGILPESTTDLAEKEWTPKSVLSDPWDREYVISTSGTKLMVNGMDSSGQPVPLLFMSRSVPWEGADEFGDRIGGPGVILLSY
jgi:hypothetical protein